MEIEVNHKPQHGGNLWRAAEKFGVAPEDFLDFSANINPLGPSPAALEAIKDSLHLIKHYPQPEAEDLKKVLAEYLKVPKENLLLGNGAAELIYMLGKFYDSRRILLTSPCFSEYGEGSQKSSISYIDLNPENAFQIKAEDVIPQISAGNVLYLGNPNNPTGTLTPPAELMKIWAECCQKDAVLIVDEAFIDFVDEEESKTLRFEACSDFGCKGQNASLIVLGSLTKFFALPGLRLGYLVSSTQNVNCFDRLLPTWRINTLAQVAGVASLKDQNYIKETKEHNKREREFLFERLQAIKYVKPYQTEGNYLLVNCQQSGKDIDHIENQLGPQGILVRRCDTYRNLDKYYFRVAVKSRKENEKLLKALEKIFLA